MTSKVKGFLPTRKMDLEKEDIYFEAPVEGGHKVAELSEDLGDSKRLIKALIINLELPAVESQDIIVKNHQGFGLDDHLGHLDHTIQISLPPFHPSPTNQEVINKQMDSTRCH